jgi:hypothetical protein
MPGRVPVVILNVRAEVLVPGDAGVRDQRVDDRVERAVADVDRLALRFESESISPWWRGSHRRRRPRRTRR